MPRFYLKPLYDALRRYSSEASAVFHMPGHKFGKGFIQGAFDDPALFDATELDVTDDLYYPHGPLLEAQELAARAFGAGRTWFLVNGTSCGVLAMIAANCRAGGKLLIARDFHYSAYNAMRFARVKPVYIPITGSGITEGGCAAGGAAVTPAGRAAAGGGSPGGAPAGGSAICDSTAGGAAGAPAGGLAAGGGSPGGSPPLVHTLFHNDILSPESVERALFEHPDAEALYLTRPNYYGGVCDINEIARLARKHEIPVLVDEAHGAHFAFSKRLPVSALEGGADFCVQSAHKTLPAFTQCAYAHISDRYLSKNAAAAEKFAEAQRAFQTSSPSFILTASLDYAREYMELRGAAELDRILDLCETFYRDMAGAGYGIPDDIWPGGQNRLYPKKCGLGHIPAGYGRDMTRLTLDTRPVGLTGTEADRLLWSRYKIKIEASDPMRIVMITTVADEDADLARLSAALLEIADEFRGRLNYTETPHIYPETELEQQICAELRSGLEQRSGIERRNGIEQPYDSEQRSSLELHSGQELRSCFERRGGFERRFCFNRRYSLKRRGNFAEYTDVKNPRKIQHEQGAPDFINDLHAPRKNYPIKSAIGCVSADFITPYPPGIPIFCPGEEITKEGVRKIECLLNSGARVRGVNTDDMTIYVAV